MLNRKNDNCVLIFAKSIKVFDNVMIVHVPEKRWSIDGGIKFLLNLSTNIKKINVSGDSIYIRLSSNIKIIVEGDNIICHRQLN